MPAASVNAVSACASRSGVPCTACQHADREQGARPRAVVPNGSVGSAATASSNAVPSAERTRSRHSSARSSWNTSDPGAAAPMPSSIHRRRSSGSRRLGGARRVEQHARMRRRPAPHRGCRPRPTARAYRTGRGPSSARRPATPRPRRQPVEPEQEGDARVRFVAASDRVGGRQFDVDPDRERIANRVGQRPPRSDTAHGQTRPEQPVEGAAARRELDCRPIEEWQHAHHRERVAVAAQQVVEQPVEQVRARERSGVVQGVGVEVDPRCE